MPVSVGFAQSGRAHHAWALRCQSSAARPGAGVRAGRQPGQFFGSSTPAGSSAAGKSFCRVEPRTAPPASPGCVRPTHSVAHPGQHVVGSFATDGLGALAHPGHHATGCAATFESARAGGQTGAGQGHGWAPAANARPGNKPGRKATLASETATSGRITKFSGN